ncbi:Fpg/Nei family DNA glycosylase [Chitinophaga pendula]|uniref:DNA-formamidopyrimidine glycosylase family protein n=1 Tax=Chitinophaga TaxID=79328 RepID=UPI000BAECE84|nr:MULTISPECIES: DNA-formamidopyrimidine glycosylase family protein [Chitinophaga]ASZ12302.1 DNA-formamidopyrimidine glycosylase [Chitinophaga sp. MD30]UCJ10109.1 Fpg/Nei family DNA glycosylase [Chitinophaga pendula]
MPELPDLQVFSHNLQKLVKGKKISGVQVVKAKKLNVSAKQLEQALAGQAVQSVYREGKELYFAIGKQHVLAMHLMLHGKLLYGAAGGGHKHTVLELVFVDDTALTLTDYSSMAKPTLDPEEPDAPDALSEAGGVKYLKAQLPQKRIHIKNFLLDQQLIRGIGNAYADEILWDARISPFSICNKLPADKISQLAKSIKKVLAAAEKKILASHPDIISGEVRDFMAVHHSKKAQSPTGADIHHKVVNSRKTYYTDEQVLFE